MRDAALQAPSSVCEMVPVIHVLVQELGLYVVHAVKAETVKVLLDLCDCAFDDIGPVSITTGTLIVRFKQTEVFSEGRKVLADLVDRFAALLVDRISTSLHKCLEVLEDSLLLAIALSIQSSAYRRPEPSSQQDLEMASSGVERICSLVSLTNQFSKCRTYG